MAQGCVAVAFSGGRDSTALLHATLRKAAPLGLRVVALHVHHGLVAQADDWVLTLQRRCARWARADAPLQLIVRRLQGRPGAGESVEAWARRGRYQALAEMAQEAGATLLLLAHHRRDQAETFLLQALRGGGASGLSAMPRCAVRAGLAWARPWLDMPREAIEAYVRRHRLRFIDDASNDESRFQRNRLRLKLWPALQASFPQAEASLAAAAARAQQEAACLAELAALDLSSATDGEALRIDAWAALSPARRANALRAWLRQRAGRGASESLLARLLDEAPHAASPARWPAPGGQVTRYRGRLHWRPLPAAVPLSPSLSGLRIERPGAYVVAAWGGVLLVEPVDEGGVALSRLRQAELRPRAGGEQFQRGPRGTPRALKKQYQAAGVAAWQRNGPLLYCEGLLVFAPGLGIDGRAQAPSGVAQVALHWQPHAGPLAAPSGNP